MNIINKSILSAAFSLLLLASCSEDESVDTIVDNTTEVAEDLADDLTEDVTETTDDLTETDSTESESDTDTESDYDIELTLANYTNDEVFTSGNVDFEFIITNVGETTIPAGTDVYLSLVVEETVQFDFSLTQGDTAATVVTIDSDLATDEYYTYVPSPISYFNVESTLAFLGVTSAELCFVAWGFDEASIGTFESDSNSDDNTFCINFEESEE